MSVSMRKFFMLLPATLMLSMVIPGVMAYAASANNALEAKNAADEVAVIQNAYKDIDGVNDVDALKANAEKMDAYLASEALTARVPWYQNFGTWTYSGVLQDENGNPCIMWVCREDPSDTSSVVYAYATATYVSNGSGGGCFTAAKHRSTAQGIQAVPQPGDVDKLSLEKSTQDIIAMVDELRENSSSRESVDKDAMAAAAEARNRYKMENEEYPLNDSDDSNDSSSE